MKIPKEKLKLFYHTNKYLQRYRRSSRDLSISLCTSYDLIVLTNILTDFLAINKRLLSIETY